MIIIVDGRDTVSNRYASAFESEGIASFELHGNEVMEWLECACPEDLHSVDAVLLGAAFDKVEIVAAVRRHCAGAQIIALEETLVLEQTLQLLEAGADDVVPEPLHIREAIARMGAYRRRETRQSRPNENGSIVVFFDGRDPQVGRDVLKLPRRERSILEYLVRNEGRRVTKTQIFNAVYGVTNEGVDECVVESHISKLRKKLRRKLGYDPVESTRYIGYKLSLGAALNERPSAAMQSYGTVIARNPVVFETEVEQV